VAGRSNVDVNGVFEEIDDAQVVRSRLFQLSQEVTDCSWSMLPGDAFTGFSFAPDKFAVAVISAACAMGAIMVNANPKASSR